MPGPKPLSKNDVLRAMKATKSNMAAARFLGCSYPHYRNWAKYYTDIETNKTLFDIHYNASGAGIPKFAVNSKSKKNAVSYLKSIVNNGIEIYHFKPKEIKEALLREGYLESKCYNCGFREERVVDRRIPLLLNFRDKNKRNYNIDNIEMLCYNCYYLFVADVFDERQVIKIEDYVSNQSKTEPIDWDISPEYIEQLKQLDKNNNDGSEYISRL